SRRPPRRAGRSLRPRRQGRPGRRLLARRAVPGAAPADADLLDRRPAAIAGLALAPVDLERVLHRPTLAVRQPVIAKRRALPLDAALERSPDAAVERGDLGRLEASRLAQRMDARVPAH